MTDHNFDNIAEKFIANIYGTTKGKIRTEILWNEISYCLTLLPPKRLRILDAGGGFGLFSQKLAALGHEVVLCDISSALLNEARKQLEGKHYQHNVTIIQCSIQRLETYTEGKFDLIINHAVLEWLSSPEQTLQGLLAFLAPNAIMSLMFYNIDAQRFHNLVSGNFKFVKNGMKRKKVVRLTPTNPLSEQNVKEWLDKENMYVLRKAGVRVIHDYLKEAKLCSEKFEELLAMEKQYCHQEPYASLGRYTHLTIRAEK